VTHVRRRLLPQFRHGHGGGNAEGSWHSVPVDDTTDAWNVVVKVANGNIAQVEIVGLRRREENAASQRLDRHFSAVG